MVFRDCSEIIPHPATWPALLEHPGIPADAGTWHDDYLSLGH